MRTASLTQKRRSSPFATAQLRLRKVRRNREVVQFVIKTARGRPQLLCADGIEATPERSSIDATWVGASTICKPLIQMDDRAKECQFGAEQPVGPLGRVREMCAHKTISPIDAVDRIIFRVSGMEEPQHALESPRRIWRVRELAPIFLVSGRPLGRMDREQRGDADRVGAALKRTHTGGKAPRLQPIVGADPTKERASTRSRARAACSREYRY